MSEANPGSTRQPLTTITTEDKLSYAHAWVGSSNLSVTDLGAGEWNLRVDRDRDPHAYQRVHEAFDAQWHEARTPDYAWLAHYAARAARVPPSIPAWKTTEPPRQPLQLHEVQLAALADLAAARAEGRTRALVVLATGLGKTLLAAFDFARLQKECGRPQRRLLFAHRPTLEDSSTSSSSNERWHRFFISA